MSEARAGEFHVAMDGDDDNPGTAELPWATVAHATATMDPGDTTYVHNGTYEEEGIRFGKSGTEEAPIKLVNAPGEAPVIHCIDHTKYHEILIQNYQGESSPIGWITIEGLQIHECNRGLKYYNLHDATFRFNWFRDAAAAGIQGNGTRILFDRNIISSAGGDLGAVPDPVNHNHGLYLDGSANVVTNNLIYDSYNYGFQLNGYSSVYNPSFHAGPEFTGADDWTIANNVFAYSRHAPGIVVWGPLCTNIRIENNIFYENVQLEDDDAGPQGIHWINCCGSDVQINNNIFYATAPGPTLWMSAKATEGVHYTQSGNILEGVDPGFANAPGILPEFPDFRLRASSPAIDMGLVGRAPYNGVAPDAGAYETFPFASAEINANRVTVTLDMNLNLPVLVAGAEGWTVECTGPGCGTPTVSAASQAGGSSSTIELEIGGIGGGNCADGQTWTVSYNADVGTITDSSTIGGPTPLLNQPLFSFENEPVTNNCAGGNADTGADTTGQGADDDDGSVMTAGPELTSSTEGSGDSSGPGLSDTSEGCACTIIEADMPRAMVWLAGFVVALRRRRSAKVYRGSRP